MTWNTILGATKPNYIINDAPLDITGTKYRCIVINDRGEVISRTARLEVVRITITNPTVDASLDKETIVGGIIINNGSQTTTSNTLSIKVIALHASQMQIIEEGQTPTNWMPYSEVVSYALKNTASGTKTISVKIKDSAGKEMSTVMKAQIKKN